SPGLTVSSAVFSAQEHDACRACGSTTARPWGRAPASDPNLAARASYALDRCGSCGSAWIASADRNPEPPSLYTSGVYTQSTPRFDRVVEHLRRLADRDRLRFLHQLPNGGRVFEVGAGDGRLFRALAKRGYCVSGNEPSAPFAKALREGGLDVS